MSKFHQKSAKLLWCQWATIENSIWKLRCCYSAVAEKASRRVLFSYVTGDLSSISQNVSPSRAPIFLATITSKRLLCRLPGLFPWKRLLCEKPCGQGGFLECTAHVHVPQGLERGEGKMGRTLGRKQGNLFLACPLRSRACQFVPFPLPVKTPKIHATARQAVLVCSVCIFSIPV